MGIKTQSKKMETDRIFTPKGELVSDVLERERLEKNIAIPAPDEIRAKGNEQIKTGLLALGASERVAEIYAYICADKIPYYQFDVFLKSITKDASRFALFRKIWFNDDTANDQLAMFEREKLK